LGLRPDISQFALLINYCFLLARYHIWLAKTKDDHPNLMHFMCTLKKSVCCTCRRFHNLSTGKVRGGTGRGMGKEVEGRGRGKGREVCGGV